MPFTREQRASALVVLGALSLLLAVPFASPQGEEDPTVNESEFDTNVSDPDESYLDDQYDQDANATGSGNLTQSSDTQGNATASDGQTDGDATVNESDFDTGVPPPDDSFLDDEYDDDGAGATSGTDPNASATRTPGPSALVALAALGAVAFVTNRRRA